MKVAVLGAAGVRTPLLIRSFITRQDRLGLTELALMDIDGERLDLMVAKVWSKSHVGSMRATPVVEVTTHV